MLQSQLLSQFSEVYHSITTKPLKFRCPFYTGEDKQEVLLNKQKLAQNLGIGEERVVFLNQTHSSDVALINETNYTQEIYADAAITQVRGIALFVLTSDCLPIILCDPTTHSIGVIHAGWKGLFSAIIPKTIQQMQQQFGNRVEDLRIYIGPAISQENYEVQEDFLEKVPKQYQKCVSQRSEKYFFDLIGVAGMQLQELGVADKNLEISPYCTYREQKLFYSYRRNTHFLEEDYGNNATGIYLK